MSGTRPHMAEQRRLTDHAERQANWKMWGPYLSERAWGTVREDYSEHGTAWDYFPHDHARSRAYRWNEDGLAGISDRHQHLCLALALWNGRDPILKERLFGLTGPEGNHGEDVKEYYYYLDATPTHSYARMLYKYPHAEYPYADLVAENGRRGLDEPEYELLDTGVFEDDRYFDAAVEYAKARPDDVLVRITITNRGPESAECWVLPTLWFRNTWDWGYAAGPMGDVPERPHLRMNGTAIRAIRPVTGEYHLYAESADDWLFTENATNTDRLYGLPAPSPYVKDAFHRYVIENDTAAVNPAREGTKVAALYRRTIGAGDTLTVRLRLTAREEERPFTDFADVFNRRRNEADEFYSRIQPSGLTDDERSIQRQAYAGMLWSKQLYYYDVEQWLEGDPAGPPTPAERMRGRNHDWKHLNNFDILSMPDKWEYPWYAAWDLAFHCIPLARLDAAFAKRQLELITREWYMHPNGQFPAYEWALGDVNPPVHAWATRRVYEIDAEQTGRGDTEFLKTVFHKMLLNFTWWVNRKDADGNNVFQGGFLGMDNVSVFDRSAVLPAGGRLDQSDGTAWMGFYTLEMLAISLELARTDPTYQDLATKFFEHFLSIGRAMTAEGHSLWDSDEGFFYDVLRMPDGRTLPLKVRSMVGLMPLLAVTVIDGEQLGALPDFTRRMHWFLGNRSHLSGNIASVDEPGAGHRHLVSILTRERLVSVLRYLLDEGEFLSPYGIRSLSKVHESEPYRIDLEGQTFEIGYQPAESRTGVFGGNSNWRGPIWFPINHLLIEALDRFYRYYGDELLVEFPTGSGHKVTLQEVSVELSRRLMSLFPRDAQGRRPVYGNNATMQADPHWRDLMLFHEYFDGDKGVGLGASHQTGWTGLVTELIRRCGGRTDDTTV